MKKLVLGFAAVSAMVATAEITSENVVGYMSTEENWIQPVGTAFAPVNGEGVWTCKDTVFGQAIADYDSIMVLNLDKFDYDTYQFLGAGNGWEYSTPDQDAQVENPEADPIVMPIASFEINVGDGFLFMPADGMSSVTVAGQVADLNAEQTVTFSGNWIYEFVNPYPVATTLKDLESFFGEYDSLMVLNVDKFDYDTYTYLGGSTWEYSTPDQDAQIEDPEADPIVESVTDNTLVVMPAGTSALFMPADSEATYNWTVSVK